MQHHLLIKNALPSPLTGQCLQVASRRWRPLVAAALGLFSIAGGASAQNRPLSPPQAVERVVRPLVGAPAAAPLARAVAVHKALAAIGSTATGGNWSAPATWVGGVVPTAADDVTIVAGATVTLDVAAMAASLTVAATGSLLTSATTAYSLQVAGSVTNNGTLDLSSSSTIGSDLRFTGAGNATFSGTGTTDLQTVSLAKSVRADLVDVNLPTLSVKGSTTTGDGFLSTRTTTNTVDDMTGTLKISGTAIISNKVFSSAAAYFIPATGGFWLSNPNFTVTGQTGSATVNGSLRISAGTFNVGTGIGNSITFGSGAVYTQEGGTVNVAGRFSNGGLAITFTLSGGTLNNMVIGSTSANSSFGLFVTTGVATTAVVVNISGGTINLVNRNSAATPGLDYNVTGTPSITGGTLQVGTAATATNFNFRLNGYTPSIVVDNTGNAKTASLAGTSFNFGTLTITPGATFNLAGFTLVQVGASIANNGILTASTTGSTLYFQGAAPQTLGGTGTFSVIRSLTVDNSGGGVTLTAPVVAARVNLFTGNLNGTSNLTIGDGTAVFFVVQIGVTGNTNTSGSLTAAPVFNIGSGALQLIYAPEATARTTGFEIPATRIVDAVSISNPEGVVLAGGNLLVNASGVSTGSLTLSSGVLTTSAGNVLTLGTAAATIPTGSATSYVKGPLGITVNSATAVSRTFAVGDAAGWRPVVVGGITTSSNQVFTATVISGATGGTVAGGLSSLNPTRYVRLQNTATLPATATVQLSYGADDVVGAPATAVVAQAATANGAYASLGGAAATTPTTGIASTQSLTPGSDYFVLANTEGGTLASSVAAVCAGTNSGTLTLSGNTGTITGYQADTGSGFVTLAGTNTGSTYTFTNLTATTTFRAVILTSDNRTVYSTPVTVTVNPATTATFSYAGGTYCVSGTNPAPTVTGTAGGTFASTTGLTINANTGAITLSTSTPSTYTVTYSVGGSCPSSATAQVTITSAPVATFSYANPAYCAGGTNPAPVFAAGASGGTFTSTTGLVINASTGVIDLSASTAGPYTVTNAIAASGGCAAVSATTTVVVNALPTATLAAGSATTFCAGGSVVLTAPAGTGNTYQFFNGTTSLGAASATNTFTATAAGSYTVVVTNTSGCTATSTATAVTVNPATTATFSYAGGTYCVSGTNPAPTVTGTAGGTFASTTGLTINANTGAITLSTSTPSTYTVTYSVGGSCPSSATAQVTITSAPVATFSYANPAYCAGGTNPAPVFAAGASGGTFTSTTGLVINASTGVIDLSASTAGPYTVTNAIAASGGCAAVSATTTVVVNALPTATLAAGSATTFCAGGSVVLTAPAGTGNSYQFFNGTTSLGAASATNTFTATAAGSYTVVVTSASGCTATSTATAVTVNPATTATFSYSGATYCASGATNPTATVTGTAGGTFASTTGLSINATTGAINLAGSTPSTYIVTYSVGGSCPSSATAAVTITAAPVATFSYGTASTYCVSGTTAPAVVLGTGATAGTFSSTTGLTLDASTGAITLSSSTPSTYTVTNAVAAANGCAATTATTQVTITAAPTAAFSYATATGCVGSTGTAAPTLGTGATAGTFSSTTGLTINATTGTITLGSSTAGTYTVTNTVAAASGCAAATAMATFTVNPRPATPAISAAYGSTSTSLTSSATTGNQFYFNNVAIAGATAQTYVVNGTPASLGSYTVTTTNANGCISLPSVPLVVTSSLKPLAGSSLMVYPNPTHDGNLTVELKGYHKLVELTVLNALGQVVRTALVPASTGNTTQGLDLSQLPSGIYIMRAKTEGGIDARRIVKE